MNPKRKIVFAATQPLGRLAKWMRLLGFDTVYEPEVTKDQFEMRCREGICLTRTRYRSENRTTLGQIFIEADQIREQILSVVTTLCLGIDDLKPFSRCTGCNGIIERVDKRDLRLQVPDYVWETHQRFSRCKTCHHTYWPGSHTERSLQFIKSVFDTHDTQKENKKSNP